VLGLLPATQGQHHVKNLPRLDLFLVKCLRVVALRAAEQQAAGEGRVKGRQRGGEEMSVWSGSLGAHTGANTHTHKKKTLLSRAKYAHLGLVNPLSLLKSLLHLLELSTRGVKRDVGGRRENSG